MDDNKKRWIKRLVLLVVDLALTALLAYSRYQTLLASDGSVSIYFALSDGFTVIGFANIAIGALVMISATGFFDIFGFSFRAILNFFVPRSIFDDRGNFYEYKIKKAEKRKEISFFRYMLFIGIALFVLGIVFNALV